MATVESLEPESSMNREELYDALVGLCLQVGITTEDTYKSPHDAVDSILDEPNEEPCSINSYTFTMKATVNFGAGHEVIMSIAGHVSRALLSHHSPTSGWRRSGAPSTRPQRPGCSQQEARGGSRTARTTRS